MPPPGAGNLPMSYGMHRCCERTSDTLRSERTCTPQAVSSCTSDAAGAPAWVWKAQRFEAATLFGSLQSHKGTK